VSLGVYPRITLKQARVRRDAFKRDLANGIDPEVPTKAPDTFEKIAREWHTKCVAGLTSIKYEIKTRRVMERYLLPTLGSMPIREITAQKLLTALRLVEAQGSLGTAHVIKQIAGRIFRYGISIGECQHDITADIQGALRPAETTQHRASLTRPEDIAGLLRAMDGFQGSFAVKNALWFSAYSFLRPGEVRRLEWSEVEFESREIHIPAVKMKMRRPHVVPMSNQVVELLSRLKSHTGRGRYVFPSIRSVDGSSPMSESTILAALRRLGFTKEEMTAHGFRSMASTNLNELGWPPDVIERQLAHEEGNSTRAAYNYAEYLPERREMMQAWADWLDGLLKKKK
jgi:integrase